MQSGAKIVIDTLIEQGANTVFGYPGGSVLDIFDELYKASDRIQLVLTSHEQGAAHAADGFARASGRVGVCLATSGPGATNTVTGIATAYMDSIPMVVITGNVPTQLLGRDSFQEVDISGVTMPITKHNYIVKDISELADTIREAFRIAAEGRPGPVLIDIPKNIQQAQARFVPKRRQAIKARSVDSAQSQSVAAIINAARRPIIYAGGGVIAANASDSLKAFAERIDAPVCLSMMGLGALPASHPLYIGMPGMHGAAGVAFALSEADAIIAVGARFSDRVATDRKKFGHRAKIVHIDIDNAEINKNVTAEASLIGDIKDCVGALLPMLKQAKHDDWRARVQTLLEQKVAPEQKAVLSPREILRAVNRLTPPDQIIATDVGLHQMWTVQTYRFEKPRTLLSSGGLGTMGFGLGAAIGGCFASRKRVFLVTGDGSFHMNFNELVTAAKYNLPVVVLVFNNNTLGMVRQWQKIFYGKRFSSTTLDRPTDYIKLAEALGAKGLMLTKNADIDSVITQALNTDGPVVIDCRIDIDYGVYPMIPAGKTEEDIIYGD